MEITLKTVGHIYSLAEAAKGVIESAAPSSPFISGYYIVNAENMKELEKALQELGKNLLKGE